MNEGLVNSNRWFTWVVNSIDGHSDTNHSCIHSCWVYKKHVLVVDHDPLIVIYIDLFTSRHVILTLQWYIQYIIVFDYGSHTAFYTQWHINHFLWWDDHGALTGLRVSWHIPKLMVFWLSWPNISGVGVLSAPIFNQASGRSKTPIAALSGFASFRKEVRRIQIAAGTFIILGLFFHQQSYPSSLAFQPLGFASNCWKNFFGNPNEAKNFRGFWWDWNDDSGSCCKGWSGGCCTFSSIYAQSVGLGGSIWVANWSRESSQGFQYQKPGAVNYIGGGYCSFSLVCYIHFWYSKKTFWPKKSTILDIHNLEPCDEIRWAERISEVSNVSEAAPARTCNWGSFRWILSPDPNWV